MRHLICATLDSIQSQDYPNKEIIVLDDASTDDTAGMVKQFAYNFSEHFPTIYVRSDESSGTGGAFNKAMSQATGEYVLLLCADDVLTDHRLLSDIAKIFELSENIGHVSRYYYQFISGEIKEVEGKKYLQSAERIPCRAWRTNDVIEQANNPSGLAFRREAINDLELSNLMFVEAAELVKGVLDKGWSYAILPWDTVAVRIHKSISRSKEYYLKRWKSSPIEEWYKRGGKALLKDHTSLIQIKVNFKMSALFREIWNFIRLRPLNLLIPSFWFFSTISIITPRTILYRLPEIYRGIAGRFTQSINRPNS